MKRTEIARIFADMEHFDGQDVTVCGWTRTIRDMKNFGFIELNLSLIHISEPTRRS